MRKLKLQMQVTLDGYAVGPESRLDWMTWNWDDEPKSLLRRRGLESERTRGYVAV